MPITAQMWERIDKAHGWCWREKADRIYDLACDGVKDAVEIGVYGGRSFLPLVAGIVPRGGNVHGFDVYKSYRLPNAEHQKWWDELDFIEIEQSAKRLLNAFGFGGGLITRISSVEASRFYFDETLDYVHIDGSHRTWDALEDIVIWSRRLKPGGWLLLDDTNWTELGIPVELMKHSDFDKVEVLKGPEMETTIWRKR